MYGLPSFEIVIFTIVASIRYICLNIFFVLLVYFFYVNVIKNRKLTK